MGERKERAANMNRTRDLRGLAAALARLAGGALAAVLIAAMAVLPGLTPTGSPRTGATAAPIFAKFTPWCGAASDHAPAADDTRSAHDSLSCLQHCLRAAPNGPRSPLIAPGAVTLQPPAMAPVWATGVLPSLAPPRHVLGTIGGRGPPHA